MKKLFLILIPIIFLFCLNIEIQTASAVTCGSCEKCVSWDCIDGNYECVSWGSVCQGWENVCAGYGDVCGGWEDVCESGWEERCQGYGDVCGGWKDVCEAWKTICPGGINLSGECPGGWQESCSLWTTQCTGGWSYECTGGYAWECALWGYECTGGWSYECTSWKSECTGGWEEECTGEEWVCYNYTCTYCAPYCSGSDSNCGCTSCTNCNAQDNCVGKNAHDYSCSGDSCVVNIIVDDPRCGGCKVPTDCPSYSLIGQCVDEGSFSGILAAVECIEGTCMDGFEAFCPLGCCYEGCCTNCHEKCITLRGNPMSKCSGNTLEILDIANCKDGCNYNSIPCECGCYSSGNTPTCLSGADIVEGCSDIGKPDEYCDGDIYRSGGYHCKTVANDFNISDDFFAKIKKIFSSEAKADVECHYHRFLHCKNGCGVDEDGLLGCFDDGFCPAGCFPDNCNAPECSGCRLCVIDCPDRCVGEIFETGGFVANDEKGNATCFYANQEWCGDGCCPGPIPPEPPSCYWEQKSCGWGGGGCNSDEMGYQCKGPSGCTEEECSKGDTYCVFDPSCSGGPPPLNDPPVAKIDCNPSSCNIYTNENITFQGGDSYDNDGFITDYDWNVLSSSYSGVNCTPSATPEGNHIATLTVKDDKGATGSTTKDFTVVQALAADFEWEPEFPLRDKEVDFTDLSAGDIVSWAWTFEDGDVPAGQEIKQHPQNIKFTSNGSKKVRLTITDSLGKSVFKDHNIDVRIPMPDWRETHPKTENIFDNPLLIFASLFEYFEG